MAYAILRIEKLKTRSEITSSGKHNDRMVETPNADKNIKNYTLIGDGKTYIEHFEETTKDIPKIRKNAVLGVECFISASPEAKLFKNPVQFKSWVKDSVRYLLGLFGKENVKKVNLHLDETTPHIHAFIVPKKDNKLNIVEFKEIFLEYYPGLCLFASKFV